MKDAQVKEILFDLYMVDEDLKSYEEELKDIILEIYYSRPDTEFDNTFKQSLKDELLLKIKSLKRDNLNRKINLSTDLPKESNLLLFMKKLNYILGTATVSSAAFVAVLYVLNTNGYINFSPKDKTPDNSNIKYSAGAPLSNEIQSIKSQIIANINTMPVISKTSSNAFGAISGASIQDNTGYAGISMKSGKESLTTTNPTATALTSNAGGIADSKMRIYMPKDYNYIYTDSKDKLSYDDSNLEVLKRITKNTFNFDSSSITTNNFNISNFKNLKLNTLAIDEDTDNGYSLYMNFTDGSFNINKNWSKWPMNNGDVRLKLSDVPADSDLITIANDFISKYGIDVKNYGKPEVINDWKPYYEQSEDKASYYIPTSTTILYPLVINGKNVYEQYGGKIGMTVSVDLISKKVDGVYGAQSQNYDSSKYDLVKDSERLIKVISNGGELYNSYVDSTAVKADLKVNNPQIAYTRIYSYDNNAQTELLVPSIVLTVEKNNEKDFYKQNVIIPLTTDLVSQAEKVIIQKAENIKNGTNGFNGGGNPETIPLMRSDIKK